jgi:hypothetical protein
MEVEAKVRFMGEIVTPPHPCSTWNERRGYLTASLLDPISAWRIVQQVDTCRPNIFLLHKKWSILMNEDKVEGKAMCYGIRELTGKKTPESNSIQRTGSPEMIEYTKMETMMRAWLKKWTPKRSVRDKKERPVEAV